MLQYGLGTHAQRWSPLAQVNDKNVFKLTPAWSFSFGDEKQRGQESRAIVHDGVIYVTGSYSRVFALDAKTGKNACGLRPPARRYPPVLRCGQPRRRDLRRQDLLRHLDARVVALNKDTGKVVWNKKFGDHDAGYTMTAGAPTLVKDGKTGKVLLVHGARVTSSAWSASSSRATRTPVKKSGCVPSSRATWAA